jgi:predicted Zn finger-like uncharacterized protein
MSQITRCPSCFTSFKVVADQLRISEGWVRCGQCKEVFDASAHLLQAAPPALLPDVSLTDVRPPPVPVARKADAGRAWGEPFSPPPVAPSPANGSAQAALPQLPATPVLDVPQPAVPAFLSAASGGVADGEDARLARLTPFAWRPEESSSPGRPGGAAPAPVQPPAPVVSDPLPATLPDVAAESVPGGYELPYAALRDPEEEPEPASPEALTGMGYPALELPVKPVATPAPEDGADVEAAPALPERAAEPLPPVEFARQPVVAGPEALALVDDRSPAAVLLAPSRHSPRDAPDLDDDEDEGLDAGQEVSFVVAARRKAFWRKPMVRVGLALVLLLSVAALALQVVIQERDRVAAMDPRTRPWLMALCVPLQCQIAPQRQIADVVIDSSSFNKARGDSYQLALAMKSKASIPLAMPAVELTLTDAQDQPVLRRVLLPADLGAPMELPARGEWSGSVSVIVTTGGARVAGYRLLAFYP